MITPVSAPSTTAIATTWIAVIGSSKANHATVLEMTGTSNVNVEPSHNGICCSDQFMAA